MEGYHPFDMCIRKRLSRWVFGNIIFGGLVGVVIDVVSGGVYKLTPDQMCVHLEETGQSTDFYAKDGYVGIVMKADPSWEKIGQLAPIKG